MSAPKDTSQNSDPNLESTTSLFGLPTPLTYASNPSTQSSSTTPTATTSQATAMSTPQDTSTSQPNAQEKHGFITDGSKEDEHHGVKRFRDDDDDGDDARFRGGECNFEDGGVPVNTVEVDRNTNTEPVSHWMRFWLRVRKLVGC